MTVRGTVRAAEPTAVFSPQRKRKTMWFKSHPRKHIARSIISIFRLFSCEWSQDTSQYTGNIVDRLSGNAHIAHP